MTNIARSNAPEFDFLPGIPGTYFRSTVVFYEPTLDVDAMVLAYLDWCQGNDALFEWKNEKEASINVDNWALMSLNDHGRRQPFETSSNGRFDELTLMDDTVRLHFIETDPVTGKASYVPKPSAITPHLRGVIELIQEFDAEILVATFNALGLQSYGRFSGTAHGQPTFSTTFDIVIHPEVFPDPTSMAVNLSTTGSMTMRMDAEHAFNAVEDLISHHITDLTIMNSTDTTIADISSATSAAPTESTMIPTPDLAVATSAPEVAALDAEPVSAATLPLTVVENTAAQEASQAIIVTPAASDNTGEVLSAMTQSDVVSVSNSPAVDDASNERKIDTPEVDVSQLIANGFNGNGARREQQRKDKRGNKSAPTDRQFGSVHRPNIERQPTPAPGPTALANAFARNPSAMEALKSFVKDTSKGMDPEKDGVDHVNVTNSGRTELGQKLEIFADTPFVMPGLGRFQSYAALWCYLLAKPSDRENHRNVHGTVARKRLNAIENAPGAKRPKGFMLIMADALWVKITTYPELVDAVRANKLRYEMYHVYEQGGLPAPVRMAHWYRSMLSEITRTLRAIKHTGDLSLVPNFEAIGKIDDQFAMPEPYRNRYSQDAGSAPRREDSQHHGQRRDGAGNGQRYQGNRPARENA